MSWKLPVLASVAGAAAGSTMTWMVMDNQVINAKRPCFCKMGQVMATEPTKPTLAEKKAFFGVAAATTAGLALIRLLDR